MTTTYLNRTQSVTLALAFILMSARAHAGFADQKVLKDADAFAGAKSETLKPFFKALYIEGEHNAVLNFDYLGLAAMQASEFATAEKAFDAAIARIEAIYADNPSAQKAKSIFAAEKVKDFKGEPYERAMTYYYRGILYLRVGDYQNARASFLAAEHQSMMSEQESYAESFGLMDYLAAWASHCDGDDEKASEYGAQAAKVQHDVFATGRTDASFVGLIDVGTGPTKLGVGKYHEKLSFRPGIDAPALTDVQANAAGLSEPVLVADINYQATTRGGRPVDAILNGKAQWKANTEGASDALTTAGYATTLSGLSSNNQGLAEAGEIGMAVGLVSGFFASAMNPAADTRAWTTLPAGVQLVTGQAPASGQPAMSFALHGVSATPAALNARSGNCSIAWGRTVSALDISSAPNVARPVLAESRHEAANQQFRAMLQATFASTPDVAAASP
jgi:tetratricopeptide (TPR) repeat protein